MDEPLSLGESLAVKGRRMSVLEGTGAEETGEYADDG